MNNLNSLYENHFDNRKISCIVAHEGLQDLFKQVPDFVSEIKENYIGTYKNIPVVISDKLKDYEIYVIYKGQNCLDDEVLFVPWEEKWKLT